MTITLAKIALAMFALFAIYVFTHGDVIFAAIAITYVAAGFVTTKAKPEVKIDAKFAEEWAIYRKTI